MDIVFVPDAAKTEWDDIEVSPVLEEDGNCEVCEEGEETFWSVYLHQVTGGVQCVADLPTKELAYALASLIQESSLSRRQSV